MKLSYLGPQGTFTEEACFKYDGESQYEHVEYPTIDTVIASVKEGQTQEGIVPIENSIEGSVNTTLDAMLEQEELFIKSEILLPIRHNLISNCKDISEVKAIISHPQALAQCYKHIKRFLPYAEIISTESTAKAALIASQEKSGVAAIGTLRAAQLYGLKVLMKDMQDYDNNITRFIVVSKNEAFSGDDSKTSIVFSTENKPGSLYALLREFAIRGLNLTKIESRPSKKFLGEYMFFVDVEGHKDEPPLKEAIEGVKAQASYFRVLGSYPKGRL
ncbi:prephenate dehydratase [Caldanaerobius polysaccharolyticus]|uniref:prephenate dehydratase n=1 Tax=Caldanaerobius polysaccharolyticus TaxID=44256 RepID=UPI00047A040C|nr:prephenate dehydratase [Caldanaerobius polysaccharolyticus]